MSTETHKAALECGMCGARVNELRRGRCWGCYSRWTEVRPVGRGAACVICQERRRDHLRLCELHGRSLPLCHTCAGRTARLTAVPITIDGLRDVLRRDRRDDDRRAGALDTRVFPRERRIDDRRLGAARAAQALAAEGPPSFDDVLELDVQDVDILEATTVTYDPRLAIAQLTAEAAAEAEAEAEVQAPTAPPEAAAPEASAAP